MQKVWTFLITGGQTFQMMLPNNPILIHEGRRTIWKLVGDESLASQAENAFKAFGATITRYTESESSDQYEERLNLLGTRMKAVWPEEMAADFDNYHGS